MVEFATLSHFNVDQYAAYAQADYKILNNLTATAGVRYFHADIHEIDIEQQNIAPTMTPYGFDGRLCAGGYHHPVRHRGPTWGTNQKTTYNAALLWAVTPDLSFLRPGGFRIPDRRPQ